VAIVRAQKVANSTAGATSLAITIAAPSNGNTLTLAIGYTSATQGNVTSVSQTGATWTKKSSTSYVNNGDIVVGSVEIWEAPQVSGAGTTVTANFGSSMPAIGQVFEYSGLGTAIVDKTSISMGDDTNSPGTPTTGTTAVTAQASELAFGATHVQIPSGNNAMTDNGGEATQIDITSNGLNQLVTYEGIESATAAMNGNSNWAAAAPIAYSWGGAIATFMEGVAGAGDDTMSLPRQGA
jgi:hypothetical protein